MPHNSSYKFCAKKKKVIPSGKCMCLLLFSCGRLFFQRRPQQYHPFFFCNVTLSSTSIRRWSLFLQLLGSGQVLWLLWPRQSDASDAVLDLDTVLNCSCNFHSPSLRNKLPCKKCRYSNAVMQWEPQVPWSGLEDETLHGERSQAPDRRLQRPPTSSCPIWCQT